MVLEKNEDAPRSHEIFMEAPRGAHTFSKHGPRHPPHHMKNSFLLPYSCLLEKHGHHLSNDNNNISSFLHSQYRDKSSRKENKNNFVQYRKRWYWDDWSVTYLSVFFSSIAFSSSFYGHSKQIMNEPQPPLLNGSRSTSFEMFLGLPLAGHEGQMFYESATVEYIYKGWTVDCPKFFLFFCTTEVSAKIVPTVVCNEPLNMDLPAWPDYRLSLLLSLNWLVVVLCVFFSGCSVCPCVPDCWPTWWMVLWLTPFIFLKGAKRTGIPFFPSSISLIHSLSIENICIYIFISGRVCCRPARWLFDLCSFPPIPARSDRRICPLILLVWSFWTLKSVHLVFWSRPLYSSTRLPIVIGLKGVAW